MTMVGMDCVRRWCVRGVASVVLLVALFGLYVVVYGARLTLRPGTIAACKSGAQVSRISWVVHVPGVTGVSLYVHGLGQESKLLARGSTAGTTMTGKWVTEGLSVDLRSQSGVLLARRTVRMVPCPPSG